MLLQSSLELPWCWECCGLAELGSALCDGSIKPCPSTDPTAPPVRSAGRTGKCHCCPLAAKPFRRKGLDTFLLSIGDKEITVSSHKCAVGVVFYESECCSFVFTVPGYDCCITEPAEISTSIYTLWITSVYTEDGIRTPNVNTRPNNLMKGCFLVGGARRILFY